MLRKVTSSPYYNQMQRFIAPLKAQMGINHFWYHRVTYSGHYCYWGSHAAWNEFCFDASMLKHFPQLRHPKLIDSGINLVRTTTDPDFRRVLEIASSKFQINFHLSLLSHIPEGIEGFGFGSHFDSPQMEERLLNELPLLKLFIKVFRQKHNKVFHILDDNLIDLSQHLGSSFYQKPKQLQGPCNLDPLLKTMGLDEILSITPRERDVLKYLSQGYPAPYIANQLHLSRRTVENYIANIKCKLDCNSKIELIQKAQKICWPAF